MPASTEAPLASAPAPAALEETSAATAGLAPPIATGLTDNVQAAQPNREGGRGRGGRGGPRGNGFRGGPRGGFRRNGNAAPNGQSANGPQQKTDDDGFIVAGRRGRGQGHRGSSDRARGGRGSTFRGRGTRKLRILWNPLNPLTFSVSQLVRTVRRNSRQPLSD